MSISQVIYSPHTLCLSKSRGKILLEGWIQHHAKWNSKPGAILLPLNSMTKKILFTEMLQSLFTGFWPWGAATKWVDCTPTACDVVSLSGSAQGVGFPWWLPSYPDASSYGFQASVSWHFALYCAAFETCLLLLCPDRFTFRGSLFLLWWSWSYVLSLSKNNAHHPAAWIQPQASQCSQKYNSQIGSV